jgi:hypothetical protein
MTFVGPLDNLRTSYTSTPPLPPVDIINLLAFGETTEAAQAGSSNLSAEASLARGLSSQLSGQLERLTGVSRLSIDPGIAGDSDNPGASVSLQQRVSKNLLVTIEVDLKAAQSEGIELEYEVTKGWSVGAERDQTGGYSIDVKRTRTF